MEYSLEKIDNIMKPLYEKEEQLRDDNSQINVAKLRLEKLLENKEKEIEEYVSSTVGSNSNFYSGYGAMIRRDLELAYKEKEEELRKEISMLESSKRFNKVDLRESVEIKEDIRKQLLSERKNLELELRQNQINFDMAMMELNRFQYEYNEQNQVINGDAWRKIYERSNQISTEITKIKMILEKVEENLKLTELTKEEIAVITMSMTPWEKDEYNRRKEMKKQNSTVIEEDVKNDDVFEDIDFDNEELEDEPIEDKDEDMDELSAFCSFIYDDIENEIENLKMVRLSKDERLSDSKFRFDIKKGNDEYQETGVISTGLGEEQIIKLPCGEFINKNDIYEGLNNLYKKNKKEKTSYIVKDTDIKYGFTKRSIKKFKNLLKKCTTIKLVKKGTLTEADIIHVHGKEKSNKLFKKFEKNIGTGETEYEDVSGKYIAKDEVLDAMKVLVKKKGLSWTKRIMDKIRGFNESRLSETMYSVVDEEKSKVR